MMQSNYFEALHEHQRTVEKLARQWDGVSRDGLQHLAQALWPDGHVMTNIGALLMKSSWLWMARTFLR